jgi:nitroreductase
MSTITSEQLLSQLHWRYATKQFDSARKISPADWSTLEEALLPSPSSFGLEPWGFIVVEDPAVRLKLQGASWGQSQIVDASHLVVIAAKTHLGVADVDAFIKRTAEVRQIPVESLEGYRGMMVGSVVKGMDDATRLSWAARQAYIALGTLLTSAALLGIDACPMEGFVPAQYNEILGLSAKGLSAFAVCTLGYRAATDKYAQLAKVRLPKESVLIRV